MSIPTILDLITANRFQTAIRVRHHPHSWLIGWEGGAKNEMSESAYDEVGLRIPRKSDGDVKDV
jgi:hypothetical protein